MRRVKILCTIGPKSGNTDILKGLLKHGMNMVRLNMSHGSKESHTQTLNTIRTIEENLGVTLPVLLDLQGPRIRVGSLPETGKHLKAKQVVWLHAVERKRSNSQDAAGHHLTTIPILYPTLTKDVKTGNRILINDGLIHLTVDRVRKTGVECMVTVGGTVTSHKGVNLPDTTLSGPSLTDKDKEDIRFGLTHHVDYLALSFVRSPEDIKAVKTLLRGKDISIPVIAKIERPEAVQCLDQIFDHADGVMLARGDLAIEMTLEVVPVLQKQIIAEANRRNRLVITATQMLESMTQHPQPTRAEVSDVANAVLDGSDVVMLSAETSTGQYPIETVQVMDRIIRSTEKGNVLRWEPTREKESLSGSVTTSVCVAAESAARVTQAKAIVVFTDSGTTALLMSKRRSMVPIIALTPSPRSLKRMGAFWGVQPFLMPHMSNTDDRIQEAEKILKRKRLIKAGDRIVILTGEHAQKPTGTNLMKIHEVS